MLVTNEIKNLRLALTVLLLAGVAAFAQGPGRGRAVGGPGGFGGPGFGFGGGKVVTGEPYSGTAVSTSTQTLANGNTITRSSCALVYRDSSGRTREDLTMNATTCSSTPQTTIIRDPVAGVAYTINNSTKTYRQMTLRTPPPNTTPPTNRPTPPNSGQVQTTTLTPPQPIGSTGLLAQGTQTVRTIPAGTVGNAQPIVITSTRWYSPDLQVVISSTRNDPEHGQSSYNLNNVSTAEPAAALFQLPSGLTQQQAPAARFRR